MVSCSVVEDSITRMISLLLNHWATNRLWHSGTNCSTTLFTAMNIAHDNLGATSCLFLLHIGELILAIHSSTQPVLPYLEPYAKMHPPTYCAPVWFSLLPQNGNVLISSEQVNVIVDPENEFVCTITLVVATKVGGNNICLM